MIARRTFLKYLAASPLLATTSSGRMLAAEIFDEGSSSLADYLITSPADALDVFDFQRVAQHVLVWKDIETRFPAVIDEMRGAFISSEGKNVRAFFVKDSRTLLGFLSEPCFEFHTDKYPDLHPAVLHLLRHDLITDITPGNCPMYRVHEKLIDWLMKPDSKRKPLRGSA